MEWLKCKGLLHFLKWFLQLRVKTLKVVVCQRICTYRSVNLNHFKKKMINNDRNIKLLHVWRLDSKKLLCVLEKLLRSLCILSNSPCNLFYFQIRKTKESQLYFNNIKVIHVHQHLWRVTEPWKDKRSWPCFVLAIIKSTGLVNWYNPAAKEE